MSPTDPRHGTNAGYVAHYYDGEKPCDTCRRGKARSDKQYRVARQSRKVPAIGLHRRVRALQALGWTQKEIAKAAGYPDASYIRQYLLRDTCNVATWRRIVAAYNRLSMTLPPPKPYRAATLTHARAKGWLPPLAYDDERIDDPSYIVGKSSNKAMKIQMEIQRSKDIDEAVIFRVLSGENLPTNKAERAEIMRRWLARGGSEAEMCRRMGWRPGRYGGSIVGNEAQPDCDQEEVA